LFEIGITETLSPPLARESPYGLCRRLTVSIHPDNEGATGFIRRRDWAENAEIAPNLINLWKNQIAWAVLI
jgi:hypothetical protein